MPAKSTLNDKPTAADLAEPPASSRQTAPREGESDSDALPSTGERLAAERTERRRVRASAHDAPAPARTPSRARRPKRTSDATSDLRQRARLSLRDSVSLMLIAVLAAGAVLGAILDSLGVAGWVAGLLVAGMTVILSAVVRSFSRST